MGEILINSGCYVAIILLGFVLRQVGFFKDGDFRVLSQIALKITLPAAVVVSMSQAELQLNMLTISLLAIGCGVIYILAALLTNLRAGKEKRAFAVLNLPGYNIGLFAMPFISGFLGPVGVVTTSLFDTGNAVVCLGGAYGIAEGIKSGGKFSAWRVLKALLASVPFMTYLIMIILNLSGIRLPAPLLQFADVIKGASTFVAMLMIGVGLKLRVNKSQLGSILKIVFLRYALAACFALAFWFLLPFELEVRQTLVLLCFSPIGAATPAFTGQLKADVGLSSAINSVCIICSIVIMTGLLTVLL